MKFKHYAITLLLLVYLCCTCYASTVSRSATFLFSDTANRPANINENTVITTSTHGMFVVTDGSYYAGTNISETIYAYNDGGAIKITFMSSGFTCTVIEMPDNYPLISKTNRPANLDTKTALLLSNGDIWAITSGSQYMGYYSGEDVILYTMAGNKYISFQHCGVSMNVDKILDAAPLMVNSSRPGNINPGTVLVFDNGQSWIVTSGNYYAGTATTEDAVVYKLDDKTILSYFHSGANFVVDLLIDTSSLFTLEANISPLNSGLISGYGLSCGPDCTESLKKGTYITLQASPAARFLGWSGDCSGSTEFCHIKMSRNMNATATFQYVSNPVAIINGIPKDRTTLDYIDVSVGGQDIVSYRYMIDGTGWSQPYPVTSHIVLHNLPRGPHSLSVIGEDSTQVWQATGSATTATWYIAGKSNLVPYQLLLYN